MTIDQFKKLIAGNYGELKTEIERSKPKNEDEKGNDIGELARKQYNVETHDVFDKSIRPDKQQKDAQGNVKPPVKVARIGIPMQKLISQRAASFLCANPIKLDCTANEGPETTMLETIKQVWKDNKLDFKSLEMAEKMMSETEVAEIWYAQEDKETKEIKFRMMILSPSEGDKLYPVFDQYGDLIAFSRGYVTYEGNKKIEHFDTYTAEKVYFATSGETGWKIDKEEENYIKKIPVIYYRQPKPEWHDVQSMIDKLETRISRHSDTNDYYGSPMLFSKGVITGIADKGEDGRILESDDIDADVKYLSWDFAPESIKLEIENLLSFIYACTDTPNLSFESLKGLGNAPSGYAMMIVFMGAHLKAARKAGVFGEGIQRRINYLKTALAKSKSLAAAISLPIEPQFNFFMPKDLDGIINYLTTAVQGGIMSKETAVLQLGVAADSKGELNKIKEEKEEAMTSAPGLDQEMNQDN